MLTIYLSVANILGVVLLSAAVAYLMISLSIETLRAVWQAARISTWHAKQIRETPTRLDKTYYPSQYLRFHLFTLWLRREFMTGHYTSITVRGRKFSHLPWRSPRQSRPERHKEPLS